jgi:transcriptional regulator with XRE-family HTH domain
MKRSIEEKEHLVKLGAKIREMRIMKKFSQTKMALLGDWEKTNLSRLENGNSNPTYLTLKKVAEILKVQIADLIPVRI